MTAYAAIFFAFAAVCAINTIAAGSTDPPSFTVTGSILSGIFLFIALSAL